MAKRVRKTRKKHVSIRLPVNLKTEIEDASEFENIQQTAWLISAINDRLTKTYEMRKKRDKWN